MSELHSLAALRQAADHLRAEERHWWADTIMTAIETLASEDRASEQIERVRGLHKAVEIEPSGTICDECSNSLPNGRYMPVVEYPCATILALDGGE